MGTYIRITPDSLRFFEWLVIFICCLQGGAHPSFCIGLYMYHKRHVNPSD
jgi:hypothetical protein